jgi:hypothetical protein
MYVVWMVSSSLLAVGGMRYAATTTSLAAEPGPSQAWSFATIPSWPDADSLLKAAGKILNVGAFVPALPVSVLTGHPAPHASPLQLVLRGVVGGPPWSAIVSGIPGTPGEIIMRLGDTVAGLWPSRIRPDTAIIRNAHDVFTLVLHRP